LTEKYNFFVNIQYLWISTNTVGIYRERDEDKYSPITEIKDGEYFGGRRAGKLLPLIPHPSDILDKTMAPLIKGHLKEGLYPP
jgi:hypothetical protein